MSESQSQNALPRQIRIAEPSIQSLPIVAVVNNQVLATGTGFIVQHEGGLYLITNYHVAAGRNPRTLFKTPCD